MFNNLTLQDINLIVGKNAVGKSKVLSVLNGLSLILTSGTKLNYVSGKYDVVFDNNGEEIRYILQYKENKVYSEEFSVGTEMKMRRGEGGEGWIWAEKENKRIDFQTPEDEVAIVARRDSLQHSYFEPIHQWASGVLFYHFGTPLGRDNVILSGTGIELPDLRNENAVISIYYHGSEAYGAKFDDVICKDMESIGYSLERVGARQLESLQSRGRIGAAFIGISVKEKDLPVNTEQMEISTGMFRALSLFIQLNFAIMSNHQTCILVDDIGEGLDFERSCSLINRLIKKATDAKSQLVMSTNDRFVMNSVDLKSWTILQRSAGNISVFNYENSKKSFDDFMFSGLNNFDFFADDYLNEEVLSE